MTALAHGAANARNLPQSHPRPLRLAPSLRRLPPVVRICRDKSEPLVAGGVAQGRIAIARAAAEDDLNRLRLRGQHNKFATEVRTVFRAIPPPIGPVHWITGFDILSLQYVTVISVPVVSCGSRCQPC